MGWLAFLFMGLVLGLLGGGGGILAVPMLIGFFGLSATSATGASLFIVGLTAAAGAMEGIRKKEAEVRSAIILAIPSMAGALLSRRYLVPSMPERFLGVSRDQLLLGAFAALMILVGVRMLSKPTANVESSLNPRLIAIYGLLIGILSGTLGAGGGFLILPVLTLFMGVDIRRAVPTSLLVICLQSLAGFAGEIGKPIQWGLLLSVSSIALVGLVFGAILREQAPQKALRNAFAVLVFAVATWMIVKIV